jgi:hypothetical protein
MGVEIILKLTHIVEFWHVYLDFFQSFSNWYVVKMYIVIHTKLVMIISSQDTFINWCIEGAFRETW